MKGGGGLIFTFFKEYCVSNEKLCLTLIFLLIINNFAYINHNRGMEYLP